MTFRGIKKLNKAGYCLLRKPDSIEFAKDSRLGNEVNCFS